MTSNWTTDGKAWSVAFHLLKSVLTFWSEPDISAALIQFGAEVLSQLLPLYGPATVHANSIGVDLTSPMGLEVLQAGEGAGTASAKVTPLPLNTAMHLNIISPLRYRGGRPGFNFGGLDQSDRMAGSATMWSSTAKTAWETGVNDLLIAMLGTSLPSGESLVPVWVSYFSKDAFRVPPLTFSIETSPGSGCVAQQRICSRRRRLGRGVAGE